MSSARELIVTSKMDDTRRASSTSISSTEGSERDAYDEAPEEAILFEVLVATGGSTDAHVYRGVVDCGKGERGGGQG